MPTDVSTQSEAVLSMATAWALATALMGGTATMRSAKERYLPRWPNEPPEDFKARLQISTLFPAYQRTVDTLAAKPMSKSITFPEGMDPELEAWMNDIDLQGRNADQFIGSVIEAALSHGLTGILVDYQAVERETGSQPMSQAEEAALGLRPYMVHIKAEHILGWRSERTTEGWRFTKLRIMETVMEDDGEFGEASVEQVRVLTPGAWVTHRKVKDSATNSMTWQVHKSGTTSIQVIPFVPVYGMRTGFMMARPPMLELAYLNVKHWQSQSDQDTLLHFIRVPILALTGVEDDDFKLTIGSAVAVKLPATATLHFVEHTGSAVGSGVAALEALKDEMRQAGAELLVLSQGPITATEVATDNSVGMCHLQKVANGVEQSLNAAIALMCLYVKLTPPEDAKLFSDFGAATLAEASAQLLVTMATAGKLSDETLFNEFQRRGIVAADVSWGDEKERISVQGPPLGAANQGGAAGG